MVPGGWQGGWAFGSVAVELNRAGHQVEAVTLAGPAPDGPAAVDRPPNLDTHIDQVAEIIEQGDGTPPALCGHSYGGMVIAGVAGRAGPRLDHLVFIDAYVPGRRGIRAGPSPATASGSRSSPVPAPTAGGSRSRTGSTLARPHPLASFIQPVRLRHGSGHAPPARTFISGGAWPDSPFPSLTEWLRDDPARRVHELPAGHNIARRDPHGLAAILRTLPPAGGKP
ncbi:alpha/beta fold hydrolase [Streptomyces sp. NPDC088730]|uniref:alpha/beta fold hydrolase n=1 Tax=Streptomyces sp. NPDC088730 TaxID=3365877 RepID=UPI003809D9E5